MSSIGQTCGYTKSGAARQWGGGGGGPSAKHADSPTAWALDRATRGSALTLRRRAEDTVSRRAPRHPRPLPRSPSASCSPGSRDEAGAALPAHVCPRPFEEDEEAVAEADQEHDVDEEPREPGRQAREAEAADHRDGGGAADGGHAAAVAVAERLGRLAGQAVQHVAGRRALLLQGDRSQPGQRAAVLGDERAQVADGEGFRMAG